MSRLHLLFWLLVGVGLLAAFGCIAWPGAWSAFGGAAAALYLHYLAEDR